MIDLLFTNTQLFTSQDVTWWTGVMWNIVMFFYQLFGLSFWRHPFTAEDLLMSKWCNAKFLLFFTWRNVSVTYVTLVPWRRERRRHVGWPTKLGSRQRDLSTSSATKRANGHWHAIIASSCRWSPREYKRQQVHRINSCFRWGAEPVTRQLSGGTATVATGRDVSVPSFRERGLHT